MMRKLTNFADWREGQLKYWIIEVFIEATNNTEIKQKNKIIKKLENFNNKFFETENVNQFRIRKQ